MEEEKKLQIDSLLKEEMNKKSEIISRESDKLPDDNLFALSNQKKYEEDKAQTETNELVENLHKTAIMYQVKTNEDINKKFIDQAGKTIDNKLKSIEQENINELQKKTYDANAEACQNYGIDKSVPLWQIRFMKIGSGIWFVIYWIFASLTICPVNVFFKGIRSFIKINWIVIILAILCYLLLVVGIPWLITLIPN